MKPSYRELVDPSPCICKFASEGSGSWAVGTAIRTLSLRETASSLCAIMSFSYLHFILFIYCLYYIVRAWRGQGVVVRTRVPCTCIMVWGSEFNFGESVPSNMWVPSGEVIYQSHMWVAWRRSGGGEGCFVSLKA